MKTDTISYRLVTIVLGLGLIGALFSAGWFIYDKLPRIPGKNTDTMASATTLQIILQPSTRGVPLDIPIEIYPIDIVAVRHEYFAERREGKRFEDFLKERMRGREPVSSRLDSQGQVTLTVNSGNWWVHALLSGDEDLEWRLPITVAGPKQTVQLTPQNAYTKAKSF